MSGRGQVSRNKRFRIQTNYYEILGLQPGCSTDDIRDAYERIAKRSNPYNNPSPNTTKKAVSISKQQAWARILHAYQCLSDSEARALYDAKGSLRAGIAGFYGSHNPANCTPETVEALLGLYVGCENDLLSDIQTEEQLDIKEFIQKQHSKSPGTASPDVKQKIAGQAGIGTTTYSPPQQNQPHSGGISPMFHRMSASMSEYGNSLKSSLSLKNALEDRISAAPVAASAAAPQRSSSPLRDVLGGVNRRMGGMLANFQSRATQPPTQVAAAKPKYSAPPPVPVPAPQPQPPAFGEQVGYADLMNSQSQAPPSPPPPPARPLTPPLQHQSTLADATASLYAAHAPLIQQQQEQERKWQEEQAREQRERHEKRMRDQHDEERRRWEAELAAERARTAALKLQLDQSMVEEGGQEAEEKEDVNQEHGSKMPMFGEQIRYADVVKAQKEGTSPPQIGGQASAAAVTSESNDYHQKEEEQQQQQQQQEQQANRSTSFRFPQSKYEPLPKPLRSPQSQSSPATAVNTSPQYDTKLWQKVPVTIAPQAHHSQKFYYFNRHTGETTWNTPPPIATSPTGQLATTSHGVDLALVRTLRTTGISATKWGSRKRPGVLTLSLPHGREDGRIPGVGAVSWRGTSGGIFCGDVGGGSRVRSILVADMMEIAIGKKRVDAVRNIESYNNIDNESCVGIQYRKPTGGMHALYVLLDSRELCEKLVSTLTGLRDVLPQQEQQGSPSPMFVLPPPPALPTLAQPEHYSPGH